MIGIEITTPILEFRLDEDAVVRTVGEGLTVEESARLARGVDAYGKSITAPKDGGTPLRRTGTLLRSLAFKRTPGGGKISFTGRHDKWRTNSRVAGYQWLRGFTLLALTPDVDKRASTLAQGEIDRQVADNRAELASRGTQTVVG